MTRSIAPRARRSGRSPRPAARTAAALLAAAPARAAPADTLNDLRRALSACGERGPAPPSTAGAWIRVVLSIRRDGTGFGAPRVYEARLTGEPDDQQIFVQGALAALSACFPVPVTDGLGAAIAGRLVRIRVTSRPRGGPIPKPVPR